VGLQSEEDAVKFAYPLYLWMAPCAAVAAWFFLIHRARRRDRFRAQFAGGAGRAWSEPGRIRWRRRAELVLVPASVGLLFLALARPLLYKHSEQSELQGIPYMIALDASRSMLVRDVRPNRWGAATNALDHFIADARNDRVGLITFSGVANLNAPLSFDPEAIRTLIRFTSPEHFDPDPTTAGSALGKAIDRAGRYFATNQIFPRILIMVSDGEDFDGELFTVARQWARSGMHICPIGVGTASGGKVPPSPWNGPARDALGQEVTSRMIESNLQRLAAATGGRYFRLGDHGEGLDQLRAEYLKPMAQKAARSDLQNYDNWFQLPLAAALACMVGALYIGADRFRSPAVLPAIAIKVQ
jgi:Ca-activated chloride channel family protein